MIEGWRWFGPLDRIGIDAAALRANYARFLEETAPAAEELGMRLCVHPDDPPRDILGLPRIVSNAEDIAWILGAVDIPANGLTLCSGLPGRPGFATLRGRRYPKRRSSA